LGLACAARAADLNASALLGGATRSVSAALIREGGEKGDPPRLGTTRCRAIRNLASLKQRASLPSFANKDLYTPCRTNRALCLSRRWSGLAVSRRKTLSLAAGFACIQIRCLLEVFAEHESASLNTALYAL